MSNSNTLRFTCDLDGLEDNWIEVDARWTAREFAALNRIADDNVYLETLHRKATGCHIELPDGPIDDPTLLTLTGMEESDMDLRLYGFIFGVLFQACLRLRSLGNASPRLSSNARAPRMTTAQSA